MNEENDYSIFPEKALPNYAPFWWRFAASFIDGLILIVPNYLLAYFLYSCRRYVFANLVSALLG